MNLIPDPLHPAVVHFPIVLILLGTLAAVVAVVWRQWHWPALAAGAASWTVYETPKEGVRD